jgi:hypothetical protein
LMQNDNKAFWAFAPRIKKYRQPPGLLLPFR